MIKNILHPGNGIDFPRKGDYVKLNLVIFTLDRIILFDSSKLNTNGMELRFNCSQSSFITELEDLIGEMSLFEKCTLELDVQGQYEGMQDLIKELLMQYKKLIFEVEIVDINKNSH
jgi:hypothetical protein